MLRHGYALTGIVDSRKWSRARHPRANDDLNDALPVTRLGTSSCCVAGGSLRWIPEVDPYVYGLNYIHQLGPRAQLLSTSSFLHPSSGSSLVD